MDTKTQTITPTVVDTIQPVSQNKGGNITMINKLDDNGNVNLAMLSDDEKEKYSRLAKGINTKDINSIVNYGAELQTTMNRHSNAFLSAVRTNQAGSEIGGLIDNLLSELSVINVDELAPKTGIKAFLAKIPIIGSLVQNVDKMLRKYDTIEKNVETIAQKIAATRMVSLRDNNALQKMFEDNIQYVKQIEDLIVAGKIKQQEVNAKMQEMMAHADQYEAYEISDIQEFATNLDRRIADMTTLHYVMKQSLPQIRLVQNNNLQTANKAQSIISTTIPVWKSQLSIAVALNNQRNSIAAQRKVTEATNELMKRNADLLHQNSIDVAKENERGIIDIETLRQTTQKLIDTIREVKEIHEQGAQHRREVEAEIMKIEAELETTMQVQNNNVLNYYN